MSAEAPEARDFEMLAVLAIQLAHDLERGEVKNATEGAKIVRAFAFAVFVNVGGWEAFVRWGATVRWDARIQAAIALLERAPDTAVAPDRRATLIAVLEQAIEAHRIAEREEALHTS